MSKKYMHSNHVVKTNGKILLKSKMFFFSSSNTGARGVVVLFIPQNDHDEWVSR